MEARQEKTGNVLGALKSRFEVVRAKKENAFRKKEESRKELLVLIKKVKEIQSSKKQAVSSLDTLKKERDKHNNRVRELISEVKKLGLEKGKMEIPLPRTREGNDPFKLKKAIESLEFKVETEALSPSEEKKVMKRIHDLKKEYGAVDDSFRKIQKARELSREIEKEKKLADKFHKELLSSTKESGNYEEFREITSKITSLREKQEKEFKEFQEARNEFQQTVKSLREKQDAEKKEKIRKKEDERKVIGEIKKQQKEKGEKLLEEKAKLVEEKLKKGGKLTTEDLMVLQCSKTHKD
jgi:phosphoserine phosphatase